MSRTIFRSFFILILVIGSVAIQAPQTAHAAGPWYVITTGDDNNDCLSPATPCVTINGALAKPGFVPGDTVHVAIGIYAGTGNEVVLLDKDITLTGGWDANFTTQSGMSTIDGQGARRGMTVNSSVTANIERFVVQNGYTSNADGSGIFNSGVLTLSNSFVTSNMATSVSVSSGGGIFNAGTLTLNNTTINGNTASYGGGIFNDGGIQTLNSSEVLDNTVSSAGGGIANWGGVMIMNSSTVSGNTSTNGSAGGIYAYRGTVTINSSTINNNNALNTNNGSGGGIELVADNLILNNSTISHNESHNCSGIWNQTGAITINNGTIADNIAADGSGAVCNTYVGTVTLQNTILARNATTGMGPDCSGTINSSGYNLIGNTSNCVFTATTGDLININPNLGQLIGPAGAPKYHPLLAGSPAIDSGNPAGCTDQDSNLLTADQRGVARVGTCDIGAYEFTIPGPAARLSVVGGDNQRTVTSSAFPYPLQVAALDSQGSPVNGVTIDLTAPVNGPSGTFADTNTNTTSVVTDEGGVATTSVFTANDQAGAYTVSVSAPGLGSVEFNLEQVDRPANDNFANAETINALPFSTTVDNTEATLELDEPPGCANWFRSVWYSLSPTENMAIRMNVSSQVSSSVSIFLASGPGISDLTALTCAYSDSSTNFQVEAGKTYYLRVDSFGQAGAIQFNLEQIFPPTNDNFANAEVINSLPFSIMVDNTNATIEPGEPLTCASQFRSVWYSFSPTENMAVRVDTAGSTAPGNVSIFLASGSSISDLTFLTCAFSGSSAHFQAEAGKTYYLHVDSYGQAGAIQVNLVQAIPPANDNFASAEAVTSLPFSTTTDITDATNQPDEPQNCYFMSTTVWYSFTPSETMVLRANTLGSSINGNVNIYSSSGAGFSDLQFLNCSGPGGSPSFLAEAGQTYYLQAGPAFGESGSVQVNLVEVPAIMGRVTDAVTSAPLPGDAPPFARATLYRVCGDGCLEFVNSQNADSNGRFLFDNYFGGPLPTGTYQIEVSANLYETKQFGPFEFSGISLDVGDLPIDPLPLIGSIRGRLVDAATGNPVSQTFTPSVQLYRCTDGNCFEFVNSQVPDSQGRFRFETDSSGNPLPVGTYQIRAFADQYQETQTELFDVGEGVHRTVGNLRITSLPVRFSEVQPCADIPVSGGECVFSVKIWNGLATKLKGAAWSLAEGGLPNSFVGFTNFQVKDSQALDLDKGKSKVFRFRFNVPANNSSYGTSICTRLFAGEGSNSFFNTVGFRDLFCVYRNAGGFSIASPQEAMALAQENVTAAATGTDIEPNNSCQAAQDVGAVPLPFVLDGNLDSSQTPDVDFFRLTGAPGAAVTIDLEGQSTNKGTLGDPFLGFFNSDCNLVALNDDSNSLNSRLEITIPADGVIILGATECCDSGFNGGGNGTYQLTVTPLQVIGSISGRLTDALTGKPLRGDVDPFAFVRLMQCDDFGCFDVNSQTSDSEGRFFFDRDANGALLRVGNYMAVVSADQYQTGQTDVFAVAEGENYDTGDVALTSFPVRFSDTQPCVVPVEGGLCEFSVKITNGLPTRLSGKAWSMITGSGIGSFTNFTAFQADTPNDVKLNPGKSSVLRFRFRVRGSVADGAAICATVYVGQDPNALFNTVGRGSDFCFVKGSSGFTLMSVQETQTTLQQMQIQEIEPHNPFTEKKK